MMKRLIAGLVLGMGLASGCARPVPPPVVVVPAWHADGEASGDMFGARAMAAGDVYGDGNGALIVGAPHWNGARGKAYLFRGSAQGLSLLPVWTAQGQAKDEQFGDRVGQAGDVNGDGHADVFVSAPGWHFGLGKCEVYYGSAKGLGRTSDWAVMPATLGEMFGDCTHPTGDLDGDGYDDLAVGAYGHDRNRGRILLYRGSAHGLQAQPVWESKGEAVHDWYGYGVGAAGDVNGDGLDDLLAGSKYNAQAGRDAGKAYLYLGTRDGKLGPPAWTFLGRRAGANLSLRVAAAGDVNGDGYADVLVTAPGVDGNGGELYLFLGGAAGLKSDPDLVVAAPGSKLDFFGEGACPAGDVDGDGYDDVAVSGRDSQGRGKVFVYRGSAQGLTPYPSWVIQGDSVGDRFGWWVAPAGDLDGDGLEDLVVTADSRGAGRVFVIYGKQFRTALGGGALPRATKPSRQDGYLTKKHKK